MVCLMCTLDAHARHELYSAAEDSFELDQLTPAELTEDNLYASLVPLVQCSASPAEAFAFEQLQQHRRRGGTTADLPPSRIEDEADEGDEESEEALFAEDAWTAVAPVEPLPAALAGVRLECALAFPPCVAAPTPTAPPPVLDAVRTAAAAAAAAAASASAASAP